MVNDKQFVIAKMQYKRKGFLSIRLQNDYILSYQEKLEVYQSKGEKQGILIGMVWQCDDRRQTPYEELDQLTHTDQEITLDDIYEMEKTWCGRYVLIVENRIFLDATGLMGIFYSDDAISSSYAILCDTVEIKDKYPDKTFGAGMGYQPGRLTMHESIRRLLPTQVYNYVNKKMIYRPLFPDADIFKCSSEQSMEMFIRYFRTGLRNMQEMAGGELWLSLTGGHDSRTLMALLEYAGIKYRCFTLEVGNLSVGDRELPKLLAKQKERQYVFIKRKFYHFSVQRLKEYLLHSSGFAKDEDIWSYTFGQYQQLTERSDHVVILRGGIWEVCRKYFRRYANEEGYLDIDIMKKVRPGLKGDWRAVYSLIDYLNYMRNNKENFIDEIDRFYWEIRIGSWLSSIEQSCDIMDNITFLQPCNSRIFLALLFAMIKGEKEPWKKKHQEKIIEKCCQSLLTIDFECDLGNKYRKRSAWEEVCARLFYHFADICLYGFKGWLITRGLFVKKVNESG